MTSIGTPLTSSATRVLLCGGGELAKEIQTAPLDKDFAANLLKAQEDIFRINRLFAETIQTLFRELRK